MFDERSQHYRMVAARLREMAARTRFADLRSGYLELATPSGTVASFLEVDLGTEPLRIWREKVESYLQFARRREHERLLGQEEFGVAVVAHSEKRAESIRQTVAKQIDRIFWFTDFTAIQRDDFFGRVWLRPTGDTRHAFLPTL